MLLKSHTLCFTGKIVYIVVKKIVSTIAADVGARRGSNAEMLHELRYSGFGTRTRRAV